MLAFAAQEVQKGRIHDLTVVVGGRSSNDVLCLEDFHSLEITPLISTEDGSLGDKGLVTEQLETLFQDKFYSDPEARLEDMFHVKPTVYACGPLGMLKAIAAICLRHQAPCLVSLEENMPCGIGVCNGCVVPMHNRAGNDFDRYRRICVDGPGVWAPEVDWSAL
jgi:dihydroorotate dehydrogenase electron transfer subunit